MSKNKNLQSAKSSTWWRGCRKGGKNEKSCYPKLWHDQIALLDRLSLLGLRECNGSSYVLQQSKKHLGIVQCTFVVFFLTFFSRLHVELCWTNWAKKAFFELVICFGVFVFSWNISNFKNTLKVALTFSKKVRKSQRLFFANSSKNWTKHLSSSILA